MDAKTFIEEKAAGIKGEVGDAGAISALSGGVDSSAATALAHRALGGRLKSFFIDDGLMRKGEYDGVVKDFSALGIEVGLVDVKEEFFSALKGLTDPEEKRKAFRDTFYRVLGRVVKESGARFLVQGTIAADILETKKGIKTQHNILEQIGIDPQSYGFGVLEPLKELYKPGVREVARALGLPEERCKRMPFPGPGLATRVIGEVTPERVETVRKATAIVEAELAGAGIKPFQAFAVLMSDRATGLKDGKRHFGEVVIIRSVESSDAMFAEATEVPWKVLLRMGERITSEVPSVVRVAYEVTGKPPGTIEYI